MERLNVNPNRMELAELKSKLTTAKQGHELLKGKQDELVHRFIELLNESRRLRLKLTNQFTGLYQDFSLVGAEIIKLAELEKACELLANEIEKIRRRVNALEFMTIPQLKESIRYIQMKLDENERGNLVRLIKVKNKIKTQTAVE